MTLHSQAPLCCFYSNYTPTPWARGEKKKSLSLSLLFLWMVERPPRRKLGLVHSFLHSTTVFFFFFFHWALDFYFLIFFFLRLARRRRECSIHVLPSGATLFIYIHEEEGGGGGKRGSFMIPDNQIRSTRRDRGISFSYLKLPHKEESPRPLGLLLLRSLNGDDLQPIYLNPPRARSSTRDAKIDNIFSSGSRDLPPLLFSFQVAATLQSTSPVVAQRRGQRFERIGGSRKPIAAPVALRWMKRGRFGKWYGSHTSMIRFNSFSVFTDGTR